MTACPCGSRQAYDDCCGRFLAGRAQPATAEQMMRSRYTAFARQNANYLFATLLPASRQRDELKSLQKSFRGITWVGLEIVATERGGEADADGIVEFRATCEANGERAVVHERSTFTRRDGRWYYVDGEALSETPAQDA